MPALAVQAWLPVVFGVVPLAASTAYWTWRGATVRVIETERGLVVRNVFRTYDLPWPDVERVVEHYDSFILRMSCPAVVTGGRTVPLLAMTYWTTPVRDEDTAGTVESRKAVERWATSVNRPGRASRR